MDKLSFEWDAGKNSANIRKHGVPFEEARSVFRDPAAILYDDPDHSRDERRFLLLGLSARLRMLVVCHCYRSGDSTIRIISARKASPGETKAYRR